MAPRRKERPTEIPAGFASSFITIRFKQDRSHQRLQDIGKTNTQLRLEVRTELNTAEAKRADFVKIKREINEAAHPCHPHTAPEEPLNTGNLTPADPELPPDMKTRGAWDKNRANPKNWLGALESIDDNSDSGRDASSPPKTTASRGTVTRTGQKSQRAPRQAFDDVLVPQSVKRRRTDERKSVSFVLSSAAGLDDISTNNIRTSSSSSPPPYTDNRSDKENQDMMEAPTERPKPKLKLSFAKPPSQTGASASPPPLTATPTPTLKLKIGGNKDKDGSAKKRKREDDDKGRSMATPLSAAPKLKLKTSAVTQSPITPGGIRLQAKGKIAKRELGKGYDSELSDTERDPVILEGIMMRMQPGPDCDYIRDAINKGTMGVSKLQGGADVGIRVLDDMGRRCIVRVRQNQYAATLVDLPCLIEGMKSWDNKRFIKSIDVSQMMLVLGRVQTDEQAKTYPLPDGVDPKSYRYAHGITAPMQWVRKRRFERTKRTPAWEIEAIDRRVNQLLSADAAAKSIKYELLDHDPRVDDEEYSEEEGDDEDDEDEDEDAEGEVEEDYFGAEISHVGEDEVNEFNALLEGDDEDDDTTMADSANAVTNGHHVDSSGFVTSNADSPDVTGSAAPTTAATPAGDASTPAGRSDAPEDSDGDDDDDDEHDHGEEQNEQDEQKAATKERIQTLQNKIDEETQTLKGTVNNILRRRIAQKIQGMQSDVAMLKRELGEGQNGDEDGDADGDDDGGEGGS